MSQGKNKEHKVKDVEDEIAASPSVVLAGPTATEAEATPESFTGLVGPSATEAEATPESFQGDIILAATEAEATAE